MNVEEKYAQLLINYCLALKEGETVCINSNYLAEHLLKEVYKYALLAGAHPFLFTDLPGRERLFYQYAKDHQLKFISPFMLHIMENFDAYLYIRAAPDQLEAEGIDLEKKRIANEANKVVNELYMKRTGSGQMRRSLCEYPTEASAKRAGMSLKQFQEFVYNACNLNAENPEAVWLKVRKEQQKIVDLLNNRTKIRYFNNETDITFSTKGRTWINSDGRSNMPSGEVYTSPEEDSVNGYIKFSYPSHYMEKEFENVFFEVKDGEIIDWEASKGKAHLDKILALPGAKRFGEAAIGTNKNIKQPINNILFDEKIGGTVHMAIGQSYYQAGGKNTSSVHWDLITDMRNGGEIYADDELIYRNGEFLFL